MHAPTRLEDRIAAETESGRESMKVWTAVWRKMPPNRRLEKAFELTEEVRQLMRAGIANRNPGASDEEVQGLYVDALLSAHGLSLEKINKERQGC